MPVSTVGASSVSVRSGCSVMLASCKDPPFLPLALCPGGMEREADTLLGAATVGPAPSPMSLVPVDTLRAFQK